MTSAFGQIVIASQVEHAVRDVLQKYFPAYLREVERIMEWEREPLPAPRNYIGRNSFQAQPGEELPKVVVISPGLLQRPTHPDADGFYNAVWHVGVGVATAAQTEDEADDMIKMYGAAARAILVQHQDLEHPNMVSAVYWLDENYDDLPGLTGQLAVYKSAGEFFGVEVPQAVSRFTQPEASEAPQPLSTVETVIADINRLDDPTTIGTRVITHS